MGPLSVISQIFIGLHTPVRSQLSSSRHVAIVVHLVNNRRKPRQIHHGQPVLPRIFDAPLVEPYSPNSSGGTPTYVPLGNTNTSIAVWLSRCPSRLSRSRSSSSHPGRKSIASFTSRFVLRPTARNFSNLCLTLPTPPVNSRGKIMSAFTYANTSPLPRFSAPPKMSSSSGVP